MLVLLAKATPAVVGTLRISVMASSRFLGEAGGDFGGELVDEGVTDPGVVTHTTVVTGLG